MRYHHDRYAGLTGFTLIELVVVIVIAAILAMFVAPRLDIGFFRKTGFFQQAHAAIRYAQKMAIGSGCNMEVNISAGGCLLRWSNPAALTFCPADTQAVPNPATGQNNFCGSSTPEAAPTGGNFRFDKIGRPMNTANAILTSARDVVIGTRTLRVEAETGFTHEI